MKLTLQVWRQAWGAASGSMQTYIAEDVSPDMSFLEMLDIVNDELTTKARSRSPSTTTAARASAARARSPSTASPTARRATTTCQLYMRKFKDGDDHLHRAVARARVPGHPRPHRRSHRLRPHQQAGGFITARTGAAPEGMRSRRQTGCRRRHGSRRLHRLRRLRGRLPERQRHALRRRQISPPRAAAPGPARAVPARREHGRHPRRTGLPQLLEYRRVCGEFVRKKSSRTRLRNSIATCSEPPSCPGRIVASRRRSLTLGDNGERRT